MLDGLRPSPDLTLVDWSNEKRVLSSKDSPEPGRYKTSRTPYVEEIMIALSVQSPTRRVSWMKASQIGATEVANCFVGYIIDHAPAPIIAVQPTVDMAERFSKQRITPMLEECPSLRRKVSAVSSRSSSNTTLFKDFLGGVLLMTGANSAVGLRSMPAKYAVADEVAAYPGDVDGEGDPLDLINARLRNFSRSKMFMPSTPTIEGRCKIQAEFERGTMEYYNLACPHCDHRFVLKMGNIKIRDDKKAADYLCDGCGSLIEEYRKTDMLAKGEWIATNDTPEEDDHRSFHTSALYSPLGWYSWLDAVLDLKKTKHNEAKLRAFVNTVLGETWKQKGEAPEWEKLYNRREEYAAEVPKGGVFLTAGCDVQKNRLEVEIVAWGRNRESWSVDYIVLMGDTSEDKVWSKLDDLMAKTWKHELGADLPLRVMAVDAGYNTQMVYAWTRKYPKDRVMAVRGRDNASVLVGHPKAVDVTISGRKISRGAQKWDVGVSLAKSELYGWLRQEQPTNPLETGYPLGFCHFPKKYDSEYFKMLCAEQLVSKLIRGYRRYQWEKIRDRNEAVDCRNYARAAAHAVGLDRWGDYEWEMAEEMLRVIEHVEAPKPKRQNPNDGYLSRWQ